MVFIGRTNSTMDITKVYKGDLKPGDVVTISEKYYNTEGKEQVIPGDTYSPSVVGQEYIFFLSEGSKGNPLTEGTYIPTFREASRYPVIDKKARSAVNISSMDANDLNICEISTNRYKVLYQDVLDEYLTK